jgi:hypothetical protein
MLRIFLIIIICTFYSDIADGQTMSVVSHADSTAWSIAKVLQMQLNCTDSQFYRIYEVDKIKLRQLDSVSTLSLSRDMKAGSILEVNHLFYENLRAILSASQWGQFRDAEKKRRDVAIERLKSRGVVIRGLPQDDIN